MAQFCVLLICIGFLWTLQCLCLPYVMWLLLYFMLYYLFTILNNFVWVSHHNTPVDSACPGARITLLLTDVLSGLQRLASSQWSANARLWAWALLDWGQCHRVSRQAGLGGGRVMVRLALRDFHFTISAIRFSAQGFDGYLLIKAVGNLSLSGEKEVHTKNGHCSQSVPFHSA